MRLLDELKCLIVLAAAVATGMSTAPHASAQGAPLDTLPALVPKIKLVYSPFDTVRTREYFSGHSLSLDNFLETQTGYFVGRYGPIGGTALFSRYAIGRGRGRVYLGLVPVNDPQDDIAPLQTVPTTAVEQLVLDGEPSTYLPVFTNIEGAIHIVGPSQSSRRPLTFLELATGDRDLRQRRVRFSTPHRKVGVDVAYDDLRDNGYTFDGTGNVRGDNYGSSATRGQTFNVRGQLEDDQAYLISFRRFESSFQGDLVDPDVQSHRTGYVGLLDVTLGAGRVVVYERGFSTTAEDSVTENRTLAVAANVPVRWLPDQALQFGVTGEEIEARQRIGGGEDVSTLRRTSVGLNGRTTLSTLATVRYAASVTHDDIGNTAFGGHAGLFRTLGKHWAMLEVRRNFRMPNVGELFKPAHDAPGSTTQIVGNKYVSPEATLEIAGRLYGSYGPLHNEVRATAISASNPILSTPVVIAGSDYVRPENGARQQIAVLEDRFRLLSRGAGFEFITLGGAEVALGDRVGFFEAMPQYRLNATLSIGRVLFKGSSELTLSGEYQHVSKRLSNGFDLDPFNVVNAKVEFRLIDARLYLMWLNVSDERYATIAPYLMTPRSFLFGIQWTLFD